MAASAACPQCRPIAYMTTASVAGRAPQSTRAGYRGRVGMTVATVRVGDMIRQEVVMNRRKLSGAITTAGLPLVAQPYLARAAKGELASDAPLDIATFHAGRRFADVKSGHIAYVEQGEGPAALFIHGVPLNGFHWRHVVSRLRHRRRCIAIDLMGLGYTQIAPSQDVSFVSQA